ncbi:hypothetical protein PENSTE_c030G09394 [Penicillium steckii]|uniref:Alcohol dehydrogenase-like C-terminal domain-containing protein n=1 Tax=Penicillium steckii TaxID=303698 RepID=A0A1V6SND1_9EURO|nr:hypothetical protein PENSTE_c030G09394 [Penicillium steckii]
MKTSRFEASGREILHYIGPSTFSQYTVAADISIIVVTPKIVANRSCLLGCGITTGHGAAVKVAKVDEGSTVAVFGLSIIQSTMKNKASKIIEIWTRKVGATDLVSSKKLSDKTIQETISEMTDGGCDYTVDCTGIMRAALKTCHRGWGESIVIGVAAAGQESFTRPFQLVTRRAWKGCAFGGVKGRSQLPGLVDDYLNGKLKIDEFISPILSLWQRLI